ncbi:unnamed protein product [Nippostrongylus brasiliensis]|uniref:G_PROTEIN_RECEP_F1_2 domain-containing protein n=1 Tax=Nippostrongylus brasiliensis TaxID=27835 RepID=A0A0N4Y155_NIPBR|nr:unnamed protein product [Nippostrongylus brasiliensis]
MITISLHRDTWFVTGIQTGVALLGLGVQILMIVCLLRNKHILLKKPFYMAVLFHGVLQSTTNSMILLGEISQDLRFNNACMIYWIAVIVSAVNNNFFAFAIFLTGISRFVTSTSGRCSAVLLKKKTVFWISLLLLVISVVTAIMNNGIIFMDTDICIMTIVYNPNSFFCFAGTVVEEVDPHASGSRTCQVNLPSFNPSIDNG